MKCQPGPGVLLPLGLSLGLVVAGCPLPPFGAAPRRAPACGEGRAAADADVLLVDRIEGPYAVIWRPADDRELAVPLSCLPPRVREGTHLLGGEPDRNLTTGRARRVEALLRALEAAGTVAGAP